MAMNRYGQPIGEPMPDWQPARRPGGATLGGRFCSLAPLEPQRDYAALYDAFQLAPDGRDWPICLSNGPIRRRRCCSISRRCRPTRGWSI